jgi:anti-anti-sigma factor
VCVKQQHRDSQQRSRPQAALTEPRSNGRWQGRQALTVTALPCSADNVLVLQLSGDIDLCTVERLREYLDGHLSGAYRGMVLDCAEVSFLAACGIGLLVEIVDRARLAQVQIRLVAQSRAVLRALQVTGVNDHVRRRIRGWARKEAGMTHYSEGTVLTCAHEGCDCRVHIDKECHCSTDGRYMCACGAPLVEVDGTSSTQASAG